MGVVDIMLR